MIKWEIEQEGGGKGRKKETVVEHHVKGRFPDVKSPGVFSVIVLDNGREQKGRES